MTQAVKAKATPIITLISQSCQKLLTSKASLPSMPDVAARIHGAMASPNWSISTIAAIIKGDPGTTTYFLQIANSALLAGRGQVRAPGRPGASETLGLRAGNGRGCA